MARPPSSQPPRAWQRMLSGRRLDLLDPSPLDIEIEDIAHGLARVPRWNGQTTGAHAFSVAQHVLLVETVARLIQPEIDAENAEIVLLHDAPEYVVGDMISPFKAVIGGNYKQVEKRLAAAIHQRFSLPATPPRAVKALTKRADTIAAYFEATRLAGFSEIEARQYFGTPRGIAPEALGDLLTPQATQAVERRFLERFTAIENERAAQAPSKARKRA